MNKIATFIKKFGFRGITRRIDELGRILIPVEMRRMQNVEDGKTKVNIYSMNEYVIIEVVENQQLETNRKFDEIGRIVVNKEIRDKMDWKEKDYIEIWNYENYFILKKVEM